jgi:hypothetical protein
MIEKGLWIKSSKEVSKRLQNVRYVLVVALKNLHRLFFLKGVSPTTCVPERIVPCHNNDSFSASTVFLSEIIGLIFIKYDLQPYLTDGLESVTTFSFRD